MESSDQNMKLYACMDALLDEMEDFVRETYGCDSAGWRSGDFAAGALLEYKGRHGDGRMGHWTVGDVRTFLLGWFPRTVMADEDVRSDVPDCIAVFFRFMARRGSLTGAPLHELEAACTDLRGQFLSNCSDPRLWDAAKVRLSPVVAPPAADVHDAHPPLYASAGARRRRTRGAARPAARTDPSGPVPRSTTPRFS